MTTKEMIEQLQTVTDQTIPVCVLKSIHKMGSSRTGTYWSGNEPVNITRMSFIKGDAFAGLTGLDKIDHIEIEFEDEDYHKDYV